ncbi:MAG: hypothetical protein MUC79_15035 [Thiobacillaceae bacterium]|jgi:hypothetical protein|nr:hypothetical protein [Thiobacillaceae bacterium]
MTTRAPQAGDTPIHFITLVIPRASLDASHPGGVSGFLERYPHARQDRDFICLVFMSDGEAWDTLDELRASGVEGGLCCWTRGPLAACPGVEFFATGDRHELHPGWHARLAPWIPPDALQGDEAQRQLARNDRQSLRRFTRALAEGKTLAEMDPEVALWWWNRY